MPARGAKGRKRCNEGRRTKKRTKITKKRRADEERKTFKEKTKEKRGRVKPESLFRLPFLRKSRVEDLSKNRRAQTGEDEG